MRLNVCDDCGEKFLGKPGLLVCEDCSPRIVKPVQVKKPAEKVQPKFTNAGKKDWRYHRRQVRSDKEGNANAISVDGLRHARS